MNEREELARAVFVADNAKLGEEQAGAEWDRMVPGHRRATYAYGIADGLLVSGALRAIRMRAVEDAMEGMTEVIERGNAAEVAAEIALEVDVPVAGGAGRHAAMTARDELYEDPVDWLRVHVQRLGVEP